ncbi:hypothetical protein SAMN05421863_10226 [Nitrosomonas communis]|uniref:Uncharacterized protein n=1 Tax=Nitrosomonas communis TaxID=44574 RepID=A0A1I4PNT3_9PROT|nr:hypothetical protein SAMN05421863_10226 [Nitrosomonas communis]
MKIKEIHIVPLARQVIEIVREIQSLTEEGRVYFQVSGQVLAQ